MKPARQARVICIALGVCLAAYAAPSTPFERAQHQRAVPLVFVNGDAERVGVGVEVLIGPAEDDVGRRRHAREHLPRRYDRGGRRRGEQRAVRRDAGDRKQRKLRACENRRGVVEMAHAFDAALRPRKAVGAHLRARRGGKARDLLLALVTERGSQDGSAAPDAKPIYPGA